MNDAPLVQKIDPAGEGKEPSLGSVLGNFDWNGSWEVLHRNERIAGSDDERMELHNARMSDAYVLSGTRSRGLAAKRAHDFHFIPKRAHAGSGGRSLGAMNKLDCNL